MAADNEAVGLSRVHIYEPKCILPLREITKSIIRVRLTSENGPLRRGMSIAVETDNEPQIDR